MNEFYGKEGIFSSGRDLTVEEVVAGISLAHSEHGHDWGGGDSFDREFIRDLVFTKVELHKMYA